MGYCKICGRPLRDGEVCNCQQVYGYNNQQNVNQQQTYQTQGYEQYQQQYGYSQNYEYNNQNNYQNTTESTSIIGSIIKLLKSPVKYGKVYTVNANIVTSVILILLQAIFTGLVALIACFKVKSYISQALSLASLSGLSSYKSMSDSALSLIKIPYVSSFLLTILISLVLTLILAGLIFVGCKIIKNEVNFIQVIAVVSVRSLFLVLMSFIACLLTFINVYIGLFVFFTGNAISFIFMAKAFPVIDDSISDRIVYMLAIIYILSLVIMAFAISKCWQIYLPDTIKLGIKQIQSQFKGKSIYEIIQYLVYNW